MFKNTVHFLILMVFIMGIGTAGLAVDNKVTLDNKIAELTPLAENGDAEAQFQLGSILVNAPYKDVFSAQNWFIKASEQNHCKATLYLGFMVQRGWGKLKKDKSGAISYFIQGANAGCPTAQTMLGHAYKKGKGVPKSLTKAINWYKKAGETGEPIASYFVGEFYWKGKGTKKDIPEALYWLSLAFESETEGKSKKRVDKLIKKVKKKLKPEQIASVETRVEAWKKSQEEDWEALIDG